MVFMKLPSLTAAILTAVFCFNTFVNAAWNKTLSNNVVVYWGQNALGSYENDTTKHQQGLLTYCQDPSIDLIPVAFLNKFVSIGGQPEVNFANACTGWQLFPGTNLLWCPSISQDIITCQKEYGKKILLSIGGSSAGYGGWSSETEAKAFADRVWNMFGKGWSYYRPFGDAIVDGFDLDLEVGPNTGYDHFAWRLRQLMNADTVLTGKEWILTAAPQCPLPDAMLDSALRSTSFDAVFVQFYNNPSCGANTWVLGKNQTNGDGFNFGQWDIWAKTKSRNNKIKVFLTVPMSPEAGNGYVSRTVVGKIIGDIKRYSSLGGFGAWDASVAAQNIGYLAYAKNALNTASIPPVKTPVPAKRDTMPEVHSTPHRHVHRKHRRGLF